MKKLFSAALLALLATFSPIDAKDFTLPSTETAAERDARMQWWTESRFGMFIHFGLYSLPARHEWVRKKERISDEAYQKYFDHFNPDLFNPADWAKAAKAAGMKYVVITTKHHEGFCLWDSKYTEFKVTNTPFGRDLLREFVDAFRAEGIRIGLYYSLIDWNHRDFTIDKKHPLRIGGVGEDDDNDGDLAKYAEINKGKDMTRYRQYMKNQVRELLTGYGPIDIIWFDFSYPGKLGKDRYDWDSEGLLKLAKTLQPNILVDSRLDLNDVKGGWDFMTPEQYKVKEGLKMNGERIPWETCQTFSGSWGYYRDETSWKNEAQLINLLNETVSKGGNLIMNVGPTARGEFDSRAKDRLDIFAKWMHFNSRSIYGCTYAPDGFKAPECTVLTFNPKTNRLYIHLLNYPTGALNFDFADKVEYAQFLHDASEIEIISKKGSDASGDKTVRTFFKLPILKPKMEMPVIEVFLKKSTTHQLKTDGLATAR